MRRALLESLPLPELLLFGLGPWEILQALLSAAFGVAVFHFGWKARHATAAGRLREIEAGTRCLSCDGTDVRLQAGVLTCTSCGYETTLHRLRRSSVSSTELRGLTMPDDE